MQDATLVFLTRDNQILLGLKKRGFAQGKLNGFGGKIEAGETVQAAAARELREECGVEVDVTDLTRVARLEFFFPAKPEWDQVVHAFLVECWRGEPRETDEMLPICGLTQKRFPMLKCGQTTHTGCRSSCKAGALKRYSPLRVTTKR